MSDPRRPDEIITISTAYGRKKHSFELFVSSQFPSKIYSSQPQADDFGVPTVRLRHNGVWMPPGSKRLMTVDEVMAIIGRSLVQKLKDSDEARRKSGEKV